MSLLNDALRKKKKELRENLDISPIQATKKTTTIGKITRYGAVALLSVISVFVLLGVWHLVSRSIPPHDEPIKVTRQIVDNGLPERQESIINSPPREPRPLKPLIKEELKEVAVSVEIKHEEKNKDLAATEDAARLKAEIKMAVTPSKTNPLEIEKKSEEKKADKTNESVFYLKALSYHKRNMLKEASQMYLEVLKIKPQHYDSIFNLASVYMKTAAYSKAYPLLVKLKDSDPENPQVLLNLAIAEIGLGRPDEAIFYLNMAEDRKGEPQFEIYLHKGVANSQLNLLDEALTWYKKAQELDPNNCQLIFNIAVAYDKLQRYNEALVHYEIFLKKKEALSSLEKNDVESRIRKLRTYLETKKDANP